MVQFHSALVAFKSRFYRRVRGDLNWITEDFLKECEEAEEAVDEDDLDDDDSDT